MHKISEELTQATRSIHELVEQVGEGDAVGLARLLRQRVERPESYATLVGETSGGKTSLINGLFKRPLLPVSAHPTTGTVTQVITSSDGDDRFSVINRDGTQEEIDRSAFNSLTREPDHRLLRLRVEASLKEAELGRINIFDTPGFNSIVTEHEQVLRCFLPNSDVVVFVVAYRVGFARADKDLLGILRQATSADEKVPVILVVNRVPPDVGTDSRRIREIESHFRDALRRHFTLHLIHSVAAPEPGKVALPQCSSVWSEVANLVDSEERHATLQLKLRYSLVLLGEDVLGSVDRRLSMCKMAVGEVSDIEGALDELESSLQRSREAVRRCTQRLANLVPKNLEGGCAQIKQNLAAVVNRSERWLGKEDCLAYIQSHALEHAVKTVATGTEQIIEQELTRLDEELQEIADTVVHKIHNGAQIHSDYVKEFAAGLVLELGRRVAGNTASNLLRGFGGVGGIAAGTGNLAKTLFSRAGRLIGKTFSRDFYNAIGRFFTKKMMQRISVVLNVAIEAGRFVYSALTWQKKFVEKLGEVADEWLVEATEQFLEEDLPRMEESNMQMVGEIYETLLAETRALVEERIRGVDENEIRKLESARAGLTEILASIGAKECG